VKEVLRSNDPILLSWAEAVLAEAGMDPVLFDQHASVIEGSITAIERRIMVPDDQADRARRLLEEGRREHG
jgi:hypothetical protein